MHKMYMNQFYIHSDYPKSTHITHPPSPAASPHVSGILALGLSISNALDRSYYTDCLYATAKDIEDINDDVYTLDPVTGEAGAVRGLGAGVVQVSSRVQFEVQRVDPVHISTCAAAPSKQTLDRSPPPPRSPPPHSP